MSRNSGIGEVYTYHYKDFHRTRNAGFGYYDPEKVKTKPDPTGKVLVDGVLSVFDIGKPEPEPEPKMEEIVVGNQIWMKNSYNVDNMGTTKNGIKYYSYQECDKIYKNKIYPENFVLPNMNDVLILRKHLVEHPEDCKLFAQKYTGEIHPCLKYWNERLVLWYNKCDYIPKLCERGRMILQSNFDIDIEGKKNIYSTLAVAHRFIPIRLIKKVS